MCLCKVLQGADLPLPRRSARAPLSQRASAAVAGSDLRCNRRSDPAPGTAGPAASGQPIGLVRTKERGIA